MKSLKVVLGLFIISLINCEDSKTLLTKKIEEYVKSLLTPSSTQNLIDSYDKKIVDAFFYTFDQNKVDEVKVKFNLPDSVVSCIKLARLAKINGNENLRSLSNYTYEKEIVSARREDDGKISLALLKTRSRALIKKRFEIYYTKECHTTALIFKKCKKVSHIKEKKLTASEEALVNNAVQYSANQLLLDVINIIKKGDRLIRNGVTVTP